VAEKPAFHHEVVFAACVSTLVSSPVQAREMRGQVIQMLAHLHSVEEEWLLSETDLQLGFSRLLGVIGELVKIKPGVHEAVIGLFRGAVEREILPAEFLKSVRRLRYGGPQGVQVVREAQRQTPAYSRRVWGSGDIRQFRAEILDAISEYVDSGSVEELGRIVDELHLDGKEVVRFMRKLLVTGIERKKTDDALHAIENLLGFFWSAADVHEAFDQLRDMEADLTLDLPRCHEDTNKYYINSAVTCV
jgi:hypothetical protein